MNEQVLFIVWRESVEAILVVGIAYAWLKQSEARVGLRYLWLGVLGGLVLAGLMGVGLMSAGSFLQGQAQEVFQAAMVLIACALILQMVVWMRAHGRTLKADMQQGLAESVADSRYWGIALLVAIAVAREGSETIVFLYGMGMAQLQAGGITGFVLSAAIGFGLALITFWVLQLGTRVFSWKLFFRITEILLLLLAASLFVSGLERLIGFGALPAGPDPLWDTSAWLDDGSGLGGILASFAGYRAWPPFAVVVGYAVYWIVVLGLLSWQNHRAPSRHTSHRVGVEQT
ncbi:FTR1 family iron permease [Pistricoccus aurantiacus]|uniref:FTR1 family iron permease n=1 Tax=Pistricoccus aurantiacus TaxID=1883414 RepID=UPI00363AEBEE